MQRPGGLNSMVYDVESGLLRSYTIDEKGKEHIYMFAPETWKVADSNSPEDPCELFIDALEDSVVVQHTKDLAAEIDSRKLLRRIAVLQQRVVMLLGASAQARYEHFLLTYPDIIQRIPQRMVASYLGITPEALSRVRKALSTNL